MKNLSKNLQNGGKMSPSVLDWMVLELNMHPQESVKGKKRSKIKFELTIYKCVKSVLKLACPVWANDSHMKGGVAVVMISNCYKGLVYAMH